MNRENLRKLYSSYSESELSRKVEVAFTVPYERVMEINSALESCVNQNDRERIASANAAAKCTMGGAYFI